MGYSEQKPAKFKCDALCKADGSDDDWSDINTDDDLHIDEEEVNSKAWKPCIFQFRMISFYNRLFLPIVWLKDHMEILI